MTTIGSRSCTLCCFFFVVVVFNAFVLTESEVFTVGDESRWDTQVNYGSWTDNHNFTVGDILEFKYSRSEHNVYEVTKEVYQSCNATASDGVLAKYQTGDDQIELKEARKYWFICEIDGHCFGGMRLAIQVAQQQQQQSAAGTGDSSTGGSSSSASSGASNIIKYSLGRYCSLFIYMVLVSACIWK
ncbi:unnamed protein product [Linum tenue]|uniref:Phytocyanin domain-containing protein n=1 Tax=Linum tenue TaxID=586396 RepID=A0AAV0LV36_9ROSI|nr:unnamed protein product [Linum tenue]